MIFRFKESQLNRVRGSLVHTAYGSGLNRQARRKLMRLADKFTPNAREIHLKVSEADDIAKMLTAYTIYMAKELGELKETDEDAEKAAQIDEATSELEEAIERLSIKDADPR